MQRGLGGHITDFVLFPKYKPLKVLSRRLMRFVHGNALYLLVSCAYLQING